MSSSTVQDKKNITANCMQFTGKPFRCAACSSLSGVAGALFGSPIFLVKTHLQTASSAAIAVGHQHQHAGVAAAFREVYSAGGVRGLWRGATASLPRICQLQWRSSALSNTRRGRCGQRGPAGHLQLHRGAGVAAHAAAARLLAQQPGRGAALGLRGGRGDQPAGRRHHPPLQPASTGRGISQHLLVIINIYTTHFIGNKCSLYKVYLFIQGRLYSSYIDCVVKITRAEGLPAFYKGLAAQYLRIGPHSFLSLLFWHHTRRMMGLLKS